MPLQYPFLPSWFLHWTDGPDVQGEDTLRILSWRRSLTLKGTSFADFERAVLPLLDGERSVDEICKCVRDTFRKEDVTGALEMLAEQGVVTESERNGSPQETAAMVPQSGWLSENAPEGRAAQDHLTGAHVVLFGAGLHGAVVARSLMASGLGRINIVDPASVGPTDPYFSAIFRGTDVGRNRAEVLCEALALPDTVTSLSSHSVRPETAEEVGELLQGATLALCCLDAGELRLALTLNRACLDLGLPWIAASLEGTEAVVGPGFFDPQNGACYQCWRAREITAAAKPETRNALESYLETLDSDLSPRRENLAAAADVAGGLLATEVVGWLSGAALAALDGRFLTVRVPGLQVEKHVVLRKPGCPACSGQVA